MNVREQGLQRRRLAPFVFVPHPVGWYPNVRYAAAQVRALWDIEGDFAVEVLNGANKLAHVYDDFDECAIAVWDQLLRDGRRVTALGGSDTHCPEQVGTAWTGVYAAECSAAAIIEALRQGRCFASESSGIEFSCEGQPMGTAVARPQNGKLACACRIADPAGLHSFRILGASGVVHEETLDGAPFVARTVTVGCRAEDTFFRVESRAADARRAFSTPVYVG